MPAYMNILDLTLAHEMKLNEAIKKKEWKTAAKIIYAMSQLIPGLPAMKVCTLHHRQLNDLLYCADHGRTLNEGEYQ